MHSNNDTKLDINRIEDRLRSIEDKVEKIHQLISEFRFAAYCMIVVIVVEKEFHDYALPIFVVIGLCGISYGIKIYLEIDRKYERKYGTKKEMSEQEKSVARAVGRLSGAPKTDLSTLKKNESKRRELGYDDDIEK